MSNYTKHTDKVHKKVRCKSESSARGGTVLGTVTFDVIWTSQADCFHINDIHSNPYFCFSLPQPIMSNADLNRLINSEEIQSVIRPAG